MSKGRSWMTAQMLLADHCRILPLHHYIGSKGFVPAFFFWNDVTQVNEEICLEYCMFHKRLCNCICTTIGCCNQLTAGTMAFTYIVGSKNYPTIHIFLHKRPWASALGPKVICITDSKQEPMGQIKFVSSALNSLNSFNSHECQKFHPNSLKWHVLKDQP